MDEIRNTNQRKRGYPDPERQIKYAFAYIQFLPVINFQIQVDSKGHGRRDGSSLEGELELIVMHGWGWDGGDGYWNRRMKQKRG